VPGRQNNQDRKDFHIYINGALAGPFAQRQRLSFSSIDTCPLRFDNSQDNRNWPKVEKVSKREPAGTPLNLDPRWRCTRWSRLRIKGKCEGERGECKDERVGAWL